MMVSKRKPKSDLPEIIRLIPGYDPYATAGDCRFDEQAAADAIEFVETCCTHVKGEKAGQPLKLEPWQKAIFANMFGWKRPNGTRRYREALVFVPRKNSKTTMAAAMVCLVMFLDDEPGAECYSSAAEREQARLCFEVVQGMIRNEPLMAKRAGIFKYSIVVGDKSYKALSAEAGSKHGFSPHLIVNDELHAHKTPELTEVLMTGTGARRQPLVVHLTTSDYQRPGSICNAKHEYASKVRDGIIEDPSFLPVIYQASLSDQWTDPAVWAKANPNLGVSVSLDYIQRECQRAQDSPAYENTFKRLHLNIQTEQAVRWLQMDKWDACPATSRWEDLLGRTCWGGLDLSSTTDLSALALAFPDGEMVRVVWKFWMPADRARQREERDRVPYTQWIRDGWITATPGNVVDYGHVRAEIIGLAKRHHIEEIAADPWNASHLIQELLAEGVNVVEHRQGYASMTAPTKHFETMVLSGKLDHGGNPVARWAASNVTVDMDPAGNLKPNKEKSVERIDPIVAGIMAVHRAQPVGSVYDLRGILTL